MPTIATLFLIAILSMLAALAHAAPPQTDAQLRAAWDRANDICIGRPDGPACAQRNRIEQELLGRGWFVTFRGIWYSQRQVEAFHRVARAVGEQIAPALQMSSLDSLVPLAYQQLRAADMNDAQIIAIWLDYRSTLRDSDFKGYAVFAQLMPHISRAHYRDNNPIYSLE